MDKTEYLALKKIAKQQTGADDLDSLRYYGKMQLRNAKYIKFIAVFICLTSLPAMLLIIGIPIFIVGLCLYFFGYRKAYRKARAFSEHLERDPELT